MGALEYDLLHPGPTARRRLADRRTFRHLMIGLTMSLTTVLLLVCGLMALGAAVLVLSAVILSGRAGHFEESEDWWPEGEEE